VTYLPTYYEIDGKSIIDGHLPDCSFPQQLASYRKNLADFDAAYSDACRNCDGAGVVFISEDPSPAGVSLGSGSYSYVEPCSDCEGADSPKCSLCGQDWKATLSIQDYARLENLMANIQDFPRPCGCPRESTSPTHQWPECNCAYRLEDAMLAAGRW
jgi:hypothetical protein